MVIQCNSKEEVERLARKNSSAGYIALAFILTNEDIKHLLSGGYIFTICNQEYGIEISYKGSPESLEK